MKTIATIYQFLPKAEGTSARGPWCKQTVVFRYLDSDKFFLADFFGPERLAFLSTLKEGQLVQVSYEMTAREYEASWFVDVQGFSCVPLGKIPTPTGQTPPAAPAAEQPTPKTPPIG